MPQGPEEDNLTSYHTIMAKYPKVSSENRVYGWQYLQSVNQSPYSVTAEAATSNLLASYFNGEDFPDWWLQVRYGRNATTIASGSKDSMIGGPFLASMRYENGSQKVDRLVQGDPHLGNLSPPPSPGEAPGMSDSVRNAVLTRFLLKCLAEQRKLQGGVFLAEFRKTYQMIRNPLKALDGAIKQYVGACRGRARHLSPKLIPRMLSEEYLQFTYGAIPLFADIKGAYDACIRLRDLPQLVRVRAFAEEERVISHTSGVASYYGIDYWREQIRSIKCQGRILGAVKVASVGPDLPLREATGLRLRDFVPTVYELIPYSFLVDYFVNVGDILNAWSFAQSDLAWHCSTYRTLCISTEYQSPARPSTVFGLPVTAYSFEPTYAQRVQKSFSRNAEPLGLPSLVFKLPSSGQNVNIAALAAFKSLS